MADRKPSAAEALYGHLPSQLPERPAQRSSISVADAMWPALAPKPKAPPREILLRNLREINARGKR
jgi:hypothetical protein